MGEAFSFLIYLSILMGDFQLLSETISSLVIGWLTLALVWAELDKRPELALLGFVPIIQDEKTRNIYKADYHGNLTDPSRFLKIREARALNLGQHYLFGDRDSFSVFQGLVIVRSWLSCSAISTPYASRPHIPQFTISTIFRVAI